MYGTGFLRAEVGAALDRILAGEPAGAVESETLDCKEDPTARSSHGERVDGAEQDDDAARDLADAAACLANHHGGTVLVGIDDKRAGRRALVGTRLEQPWLRRRIRELTTPPLTVTVTEVAVDSTRLLALDAPRNESSEPVAASVSRRGGQRRARRVDTHCQEMTTLAEMLGWARERSGYDWSAQPSGRKIDDARAGAIESLRDLLRESGEPERSTLADLRTSDLLARLQLLRSDGRLTRAGELLLCAGERRRLEYLHRPAPGARSTSRSAREPRGLAEELRIVDD